MNRTVLAYYAERFVIALLGPIVGLIYETYLMGRDCILRIEAGVLHGGAIVKKSGKFCMGRVAIVTASGEGAVPTSISNLVRMLHALHCSVLLVYNGRLNDESIEALKPFLWRTMERPNVGRDFGAYKAAALYLMKLKITPQKLVFANDSMYYDSGRAPMMLERILTLSDPIVAATENHKPDYHFGSFLFAVSAEVQNARVWRKFWKQYPPSSARPSVIRNGEVGLSRALIRRGGYRPKILYAVSDIASEIRRWSIDDLASHIHRLPKEFREQIAAAGLHREIQPGMLLTADLVRVAMEQNPMSEIEKLQSTSAHAATRMRLNQVLERLLEKMEFRSQIHWSGLLFFEYLDIGFVKKDFSFRGLYNINDFIQAMSELRYADMDEVAAETNKRGLPISLRGVRKILYHQGYL